jgi:hypothetical protein
MLQGAASLNCRLPKKSGVREMTVFRFIYERPSITMPTDFVSEYRGVFRVFFNQE